MKKIYQKPVTESHVIELHPLMDLSVGRGQSTEPVTNENSTQFSRESDWNDDY